MGAADQFKPIVPPKSSATNSYAGGPGYGVAQTGSDISDCPSS